LFYVAAGIIEAWLQAKDELKSKYREPMFWCNKHGYFRKENCLPLFPEMVGGDKVNGAYICPTCYKTLVFDNPNQQLKAS
jgi:hypothetical protein